jgi:hypothetical protein
MKHATMFFLIAVVSVIVAGCATNSEKVLAPSAQEVEWANKVIALDEQQKALQRKEQALKLQEQDIQRAEAQADLEKKDAKAKAWLAQNKEQIEKDLTESNQTNSQAMLESFGFHGVVLDYLVDDVAVEDGVFSYSQLFLWKNSDDSGEIARINVGYDIKTEKLVGSNIVGTKHLSVSELATIIGGSSEQNSQRVQSVSPAEPEPSKTQSIWTPSNETVNTAYKAGIGVIAAGLSAWAANQFGGGN